MTNKRTMTRMPIALITDHKPRSVTPVARTTSRTTTIEMKCRIVWGAMREGNAAWAGGTEAAWVKKSLGFPGYVSSNTVGP